MISVQGGLFTPLYGSSKKPVLVNSFEIDEFPVTNELYLKFTSKRDDWKKSKAKKLFVDQFYLKNWSDDQNLGEKNPPNSPVVYVSWFAAKAYCDFVGKRLPTVNEWEYIASREIKGVDVSKAILEWYSRPTPEVLPNVDTGLKNTSGVAALHGMIWEWTIDFNTAMVSGESRGDSTLDKTMYCGAGSNGAANPSDYAAFMRFAFRSSLKAKYTVANLGFRCAGK